jgi:superfamily II DNA/RNA helicase
MSYPKLNQHLQEALQRLGLENPTPLQSKVLAPIKSGADIIVQGPHGIGKSTALVISVMQSLKCKAQGETPRALVLVKEKEQALELEEAFKPFIFRTDLRIFSAFDQHEILGQRDTIFEGVDILIGTPSRISKLFYMNGINLAQLRMLIIEDADFLAKASFNADIKRIVESGHKFQKILLAEEIHPRLDQLIASIMPRAKRFSET